MGEHSSVHVDNIQSGSPDKNVMQSSFTPEKAGELLFLSFKYSQGYPPLQRRIYRYMHNIRPDWKVTGQIQKYLDGAGKIPIFGILRHSDHEKNVTAKRPIFHPPNEMNDAAREFNGRLNDLTTILNSPDHEAHDHLVAGITEGIISSDVRFLFDGDSKPVGRTRKDLDPHTSDGDPWLSHLVYYGLQGNASGMEEFDQMFADVRRFAMTPGNIGKLSHEADSGFDKVLKLYNATHPENQFHW